MGTMHAKRRSPSRHARVRYVTGGSRRSTRSMSPSHTYACHGGACGSDHPHLRLARQIGYEPLQPRNFGGLHIDPGCISTHVDH